MPLFPHTHSAEPTQGLLFMVTCSHLGVSSAPPDSRNGLRHALKDSLVFAHGPDSRYRPQGAFWLISADKEPFFPLLVVLENKAVAQSPQWDGVQRPTHPLPWPCTYGAHLGWQGAVLRAPCLEMRLL